MLACKRRCQRGFFPRLSLFLPVKQNFFLAYLFSSRSTHAQPPTSHRPTPAARQKPPMAIALHPPTPLTHAARHRPPMLQASLLTAHASRPQRRMPELRPCAIARGRGWRGHRACVGAPWQHDSPAPASSVMNWTEQLRQGCRDSAARKLTPAGKPRTGRGEDQGRWCD
jgi:hypothetical protein